jgi:phosphoserine aminotransferase
MTIGRKFNFSAGPAVLPEPVLEEARDQMLTFRGSGTSVMEISHRSRLFEEVLDAAESGLRDLLCVPKDHAVLFLQGGATMQFTMVPLNFLGEGTTAQYVVTGTWGRKAYEAAELCGTANVLFDAGPEYRTVPTQDELSAPSGSAYVHYTSNETIEGVEFPYDLLMSDLPVVCDASSNILSRPMNIKGHALIYAGAQKNIGPSGVTVVIVSNEMLERVPDGQHRVFDYRLIAENRSMLNTPNTWGIYIISLVCRWLKDQGGVEGIEKLNREKAARIYDAIDRSGGFYRGHASAEARSRMNVTFMLSDEELTERFLSQAEANSLVGLRGHRSLGGVRASIYNAFPIAGVHALASFMDDFRADNG